MSFDPKTLLLAFIFSIFGMAYLSFGKKRQEMRFVISGILLMVFTYFVDSTQWTVVWGVGLLASPFLMARLGI
jgi:hypothetical protein